MSIIWKIIENSSIKPEKNFSLLRWKSSQCISWEKLRFLVLKIVYKVLFNPISLKRIAMSKLNLNQTQ